MAKKSIKTASMVSTKPMRKPPKKRVGNGGKGAKKQKIKVVSIASTKPRTKPPSTRPGDGIKRKRKASGRLS